MKPSTHTVPPQAPTAETLHEKETPDLPQSTPPAAEDVSHDPFHDLIPGYPKLAGRMGIMPEIGMFRRFGALNARSLLYYQNELAYLEDQLKETEAEDAKSPEGKKAWYSHNAYWLNTADRTTDDELRDGDMRQRDLVMRVRCLLKEYNDALIQQSTILQNMKEPAAFDLDDIQHFLASDHMKVLAGLDRTVWGSYEQPNSYSAELVVLRGRKDMDPFSRNMGARAIGWIMKLGGKRWKKVDARFGTVVIEESTVYMFTFWITSAVASVLLVGPIFVLANTKSLDEQLVVIAASNVLTSVCLMYFTRARRADVFAITAAFAAVQVLSIIATLDKRSREDV
ncbi:uncharacterized protein J4E92_003180 [Alternaria infectoria]|uniref:uncharacterized protein n=1 Tax=Alternaria infectoria TaxID=45303 RepID=UPI00221F4A3F|nr:uncharacterized protein J4E92_003180 [Alternaria infectoria]KAI4933513.1 hypothetical protein J4E92_003180 [Alternaria infectoria]